MWRDVIMMMGPLLPLPTLRRIRACAATVTFQRPAPLAPMPNWKLLRLHSQAATHWLVSRAGSEQVDDPRSMHPYFHAHARYRDDATVVPRACAASVGGTRVICGGGGAATHLTGHHAPCSGAKVQGAAGTPLPLLPCKYPHSWI